jgi:exocyst complex component 3
MPIDTPLVSRELSEFFQSPDDLLKIAAFRKKLVKEKSTIDAKLKSGVKEQLDSTREGLKKLFGTRNNVQAIRDEMAGVDRACRDTERNIKMFDQISRVRSRRWRCMMLNNPCLGLSCAQELRADR